MLIRNWNPVDDNYLNSEEVRQQEDTREAQYQRDMETYYVLINRRIKDLKKGYK